MHWTKCLPEAGNSITSLGDDQENRYLKIADLKAKIEVLHKEYNQVEDAIFNKVKKDWSVEEIREAFNKGSIKLKN